MNGVDEIVDDVGVAVLLPASAAVPFEIASQFGWAAVLIDVIHHPSQISKCVARPPGPCASVIENISHGPGAYATGFRKVLMDDDR